jgi:hypothetical protein
MAWRAPVLSGLLLVGLISGCAGQQDGRQNGDESDVGAPAPASTEWRSDGCATPRSPVMTHTAGVDMPLSDEQVEALVQKVTRAGEARFAAVYAGLELTQEQVGLVVYRAPSAEFDAYLRAEAGSQCVVVRDAAHSQAELRALVDRITDDFAYWRERGIVINTVGPHNDGSGIEVGTQNVTAAQVELPKRYGAAVPIKVVEEEPIQLLPGTGPAR